MNISILTQINKENNNKQIISHNSSNNSNLTDKNFCKTFDKSIKKNLLKPIKNNNCNNNSPPSINDRYYKEIKGSQISNRNTSQKIKKENICCKTSYNNNINNNINNNPFEIDEEDKIFLELNKLKKKFPRKKIKIHNKKLKNKIHNNELNKVYKKIPKITNELHNIKKLKNNMNLCKYQNMLLSVGGKILDREIKKKLNNQFCKIREFSDKKYDFFRESIDDIESKEKKIIFKINTQQNFYKKLIANDKEHIITDKLENLPNLKFYKTKKFQILTE